MQQALRWRLLAWVVVQVLVLPVCSRGLERQSSFAPLLVDGSNRSLADRFRYYDLHRAFSAGTAFEVNFRTPVSATVGLILDSVDSPASDTDLPTSGGDSAMFVVIPSTDQSMVCLLKWKSAENASSILSGFEVEVSAHNKGTLLIVFFGDKGQEHHPCRMPPNSVVQRFALPSNVPIQDAVQFLDGTDNIGEDLVPDPAAAVCPAENCEESLSTRSPKKLGWRCAAALLLFIIAFFLLKCALTGFGAQKCENGQEVISPNDSCARDDAALYATPMMSEVAGSVSILHADRDERPA